MAITCKRRFIISLMSWIKYDEFMQKIVEVHEIENTQREVYDLIIQRFLVENGMIQMALKIIYDETFLPPAIEKEETECDITMFLQGVQQDQDLNNLMNSKKTKESDKNFSFSVLEADFDHIMRIVESDKIHMD